MPRYPRERVLVTAGETGRMRLGVGGKLFPQPLVKAEGRLPWQLWGVWESGMWLWGERSVTAQSERLPLGRGKDHLTACGCEGINWEVSKLLTLCLALM